MKTRIGENWCRPHLADETLYSLLEQSDQDLVELAQQEGCEHCPLGKLHRADYRRKPRGMNCWPKDPKDTKRFSLCCDQEGCRRTLSTEHRAAPGQDHIPLQLNQSGPALALSVLEKPPLEPEAAPTPVARVRQALAQLQEPAPVGRLRQLCGMRTAAVCSALAELSANGEVVHDTAGYQLKLPFPVSRPIDPQGNGNGKHSFCPSGG